MTGTTRGRAVAVGPAAPRHTTQCSFPAITFCACFRSAMKNPRFCSCCRLQRGRRAGIQRVPLQRGKQPQTVRGSDGRPPGKNFAKTCLHAHLGFRVLKSGTAPGVCLCLLMLGEVWLPRSSFPPWRLNTGCDPEGWFDAFGSSGRTHLQPVVAPCVAHTVKKVKFSRLKLLVLVLLSKSCSRIYRGLVKMRFTKEIDQIISDHT